MALIFLSFMGLTMWWNAGLVEVEVFPTYEGKFLEGPDKGVRIQAEGVMRIKALIEEKAPATWLVGAILWQHLWFQTVGTGYSQVIWLAPASSATRGLEYGIYQSRNQIFLRIEPIGGHRVLKSDFTPQELLKTIRPYLMTADGRPY